MLPFSFPSFTLFLSFSFFFFQIDISTQLPAKRLEREGFFTPWTGPHHSQWNSTAMGNSHTHLPAPHTGCERLQYFREGTFKRHEFCFVLFFVLSKRALATVEDGPFCVDTCALFFLYSHCFYTVKVVSLIRCSRCIHCRFYDSRNTYLKKEGPEKQLLPLLLYTGDVHFLSPVTWRSSDHHTRMCGSSLVANFAPKKCTISSSWFMKCKLKEKGQRRRGWLC